MSATAPVPLLCFFFLPLASFFFFFFFFVSFCLAVSRPSLCPLFASSSPCYCTPTLSLFSRAAIAALTYHRLHARRSNRGELMRTPDLPFLPLFFPLVSHASLPRLLPRDASERGFPSFALVCFSQTEEETTLNEISKCFVRRERIESSCADKLNVLFRKSIVFFLRNPSDA